MSNNSKQACHSGLTLLLALIAIAGIARLTATAIDVYNPGTPAHSASDDAVTIRRSAHLVAFSLEALIAQHRGTGTAGTTMISSQTETGCYDGAS